ncbi:ribonuclease HII [Candidatus Marsarchaeota archaeon]|nr:ribonuclease HII [Candidatus Marsarchaeota archaeon]MCL5092361.1 ribonuclease HII [Candidatus Marsarchaeota archaeon]
MGPLVISLVSVKKGSEKKFAEYGVRDSKLLSPKRREALFSTVHRLASTVKVDLISAEEINKAMKNKISLNELEAIHFARLFDQFDEDIGSLYLDSPDVIAEKFGIRVNMSSSKRTKIANVKMKLEKGKPYTKVIAEHKADSRYPVVSAASIIAKVTRDREIRSIEKKLRMKIGSGYPSDVVTIDAVRKHLTNKDLFQHVRLHWSTLEHIKQTKLTNF